MQVIDEKFNGMNHHGDSEDKGYKNVSYISSDSMAFYEMIVRSYANGVRIEYEFLSEKVLYIHFIESHLKKRGNGTEALKHFIHTFSGFDIYIYSSDELGTDKEVLDRWYSSLGFLECNNRNLKYNVTHYIKAR